LSFASQSLCSVLAKPHIAYSVFMASRIMLGGCKFESLVARRGLHTKGIILQREMEISIFHT